MTRKRNSAEKHGWKELMASEPDFLKPLVQEVLQQVLEAGMEETLQARKSERTSERQGYQSGYFGRSMVTRVEMLELRMRQRCAHPRFSSFHFDPTLSPDQASFGIKRLPGGCQ